MSRRDQKPKRRYLNAGTQEATKQLLYYVDKGRENRYTVDMDKVKRLDMREQQNVETVGDKRIRCSFPTFYVGQTAIPEVKDWDTAIVWHFHNIYMKGLCDVPK